MVIDILEPRGFGDLDHQPARDLGAPVQHGDDMAQPRPVNRSAATSTSRPFCRPRVWTSTSD